MWQSLVAFVRTVLKQVWVLIFGVGLAIWSAYEFAKPYLPPDWRSGFSPPPAGLAIAAGTVWTIAAFLAYHDLRMKTLGSGAGLTIINNYFGPVSGATPDQLSEAVPVPVAREDSAELAPDPSSVAVWMEADTYSDRSFRLADLPMVNNRILGKTMERCSIYGPAVIAPIGKTKLVRCTWEGDLDGILWEIPPERKTVVGAVGLEDCSLTECRFIGIGFAGMGEAIAKFREGTASS